jgi:hypothetical protein
MFKRLRNLFKRKKKQVPKEAPKEAPKKDIEPTEEVYEAGQQTIYDCIVEAKELGLDMREVDAKLREMTKTPQDFIKWFNEYKTK